MYVYHARMIFKFIGEVNDIFGLKVCKHFAYARLNIFRFLLTSPQGMKQSSHMNIKNLIQATRGRFFKVSFIKRTTGEQRQMLCRIGVRKHLRGGALSFDPADHNLQIVWDCVKKGYRSIPLDAVTFFKSGKTSWKRA